MSLGSTCVFFHWDGDFKGVTIQFKLAALMSSIIMAMVVQMQCASWSISTITRLIALLTSSKDVAVSTFDLHVINKFPKVRIACS